MTRIPGAPGCAALPDRLRWRDRLARRIARAVLEAGSYTRPYYRWRQRKLTLPEAQGFTAVTEDGQSIAALRLPAPQPAPGRLPALVLHGWSENKECRLRQARLFTAAGHDAYLLDFRAHGQSTGRYVTFGARERYDVKAVLDAAQRRGWIAGPVVSYGLSLGGATALQHAAIDSRVTRVVAMAPFADMARAVDSYRRCYGAWFGAAWIQRGFDLAAAEAGFRVAEASTLEAMRGLRIPVLLIVGQRDRNLGLEEHTRVIAGAAAAECGCELLEVPGATHFNVCGAGWPGVDEAIVKFCA